jgi:hypothetical protein
MEYTLKTTALAALCLLGGSVVSGVASAACVIGPGDAPNLQTIFNNITQAGQGTDSNVTASTDCLPDANDSYWQISATGGSISTTVIEVAANAGTNTFGIFDSGSTEMVQLFDGSATTGNQVLVGIADDGSVYKNFVDTGINFLGGNNFGYYLGTASNGTFYSDTALNTADGMDHMLAYQGVGDTVKIGPWAAGPWGPNEFILAWEDLLFANGGASVSCNTINCGGADGDYNDFVVMVESVTPVPVPAAVWLFGSGLLGLVGIARRRA